MANSNPMVKTPETESPVPAVPAHAERVAASAAAGEAAEISIRGKKVVVPSVQVQGRTVIIKGKWLKIGVVKDEELVEGGLFKDPLTFVSALRASEVKAALFSFTQSIEDTEPHFRFPLEWDNAAVVDTTSFVNWWEKKIPQEARKNARRAVKRGVVVRVATFDDEFVTGIKGIYDETPVRQGRPFWHFEKDLESVKAENGTYPDRSEFIGAYFENELIGFIKLVYVNKTAEIIQILSKNAHYDKRPTNALIAKAVEVCHEKGMSFLVYGKYTYGNKKTSQLADFKRRNGFEQVNFPKYHIALTPIGGIALKLGLHRGLSGVLPPGLLIFLVSVRSRFFAITGKFFSSKRRSDDAGGSPSRATGSEDGQGGQ